MEVIKVEPDFDTESLNGSSFHEDQDEDPLLINSDEMKKEVKVSFILMHTLYKGGSSANLVSYRQRVLNYILLFSLANITGLVCFDNI
jgi:hypothetical protein